MAGTRKDPLGLANRYAQIGGLAIAVVGLVTNVGFLEWVGLAIVIATGLWSIGNTLVAIVSIHRRRTAKKRSLGP